jgi:hypothetical protein
MLRSVSGNGPEENWEPPLDRPVLPDERKAGLWDVRSELTALSRADGA